MRKLYVQLGRSGDILNLLPLLLKDSQNGEQPRLMVSAEFAGLLDGVSYVERVVYDGPHYEVDKAVKLARGMAKQVVVTQINGPMEEVKSNTYEEAGQGGARTTSFQKEQWKVAGRLGEWDDLLPLVFDRRDKEREAKLLKSLDPAKGGKWKKPFLLLALDGVSSPFPHAELLRELVTLRFGKEYHIIDVPKAERLYDLLALYEKAALLIAVDSAPLHLAWACRTLPVFALANDQPMLWNGASWRPTFRFYCRYADFPKRCLEMLKSIESLTSLVEVPTMITVWQECSTP